MYRSGPKAIPYAETDGVHGWKSAETLQVARQVLPQADESFPKVLADHTTLQVLFF